MSNPNDNDRRPIQGLESAKAELDDIIERLEGGEDDPSDADLAAAGKAAWALVDTLRDIARSRQVLTDTRRYRERPIMLGKRGLGRV